MPSFTDSPAMSLFWPEKVMRIIRDRGQKVSHGRKRTDSGDPEGREITVTDPYANIIVDISHEKLDKPFQYRIPEDMRGNFARMVVEIPFGRGDRLIKGYVIGTTKQAQIEPERIKCIHAVSTDGIGVESRLIAWQHGCGIITEPRRSRR